MQETTKGLDLIMMEHGGIYKVIDEYRELLQYILTKFPNLKEDTFTEDWIIRIMRDQDRLLHQIASLQSEKTRIEQSRTGIIRPFPLDPGANTIYEDTLKARYDIWKVISPNNIDEPHSL